MEALASTEVSVTSTNCPPSADGATWMVSVVVVWMGTILAMKASVKSPPEPAFVDFLNLQHQVEIIVITQPARMVVSQLDQPEKIGAVCGREG